MAVHTSHYTSEQYVMFYRTRTLIWDIISVFVNNFQQIYFDPLVVLANFFNSFSMKIDYLVEKTEKLRYNIDVMIKGVQ